MADFAVSDLDLELLEDFDSLAFERLCIGATWMLDLQDDDPQMITQEHRASKDSSNWPTFYKNGIQSETLEIQLEL